MRNTEHRSSSRRSRERSRNRDRKDDKSRSHVREYSHDRDRYRDRDNWRDRGRNRSRYEDDYDRRHSSTLKKSSKKKERRRYSSKSSSSSSSSSTSRSHSSDSSKSHRSSSRTITTTKKKPIKKDSPKIVLDKEKSIDFMDEEVIKKLESIEEDSFVPQSFYSTRDREAPTKLPTNNLKTETVVLPKLTDVNLDNVVKEQLFHKNFTGDEDIRIEKWIRKVFSYRQKFNQ